MEADIFVTDRLYKWDVFFFYLKRCIRSIGPEGGIINQEFTYLKKLNFQTEFLPFLPKK